VGKHAAAARAGTGKQAARTKQAGSGGQPPSGQPRAGGKARAGEPRRKAGRSGEHGQDHGERGWRDLAGSTPSLVGVSGAMRARDVARPSPDELAAAEQDLVIVRRQWQPPADEPGVS
jgi:hypothetical protein